MSAAARNYVVAVLLAAAGLASAVTIVSRFVGGLEEPVRFLAPGSATYEASQPGRIVIWHEHKTLFAGQTYQAPKALPAGVHLRVTGPDGAEVTVRPSGGATVTSGTVERVSVAAFEAARPGTYRVVAEGRFEPRVLAVSAEFIWALFGTIGLAAAALLVGVGAGGALALYTLLTREAAPAVPAGAGLVQSAAEAPPDKRLRDLTTLVYGLHAASLLFGVTAIAAVIVNYVKRSEVAGTWLESHFTWQIRTFWFMLLWTVVGLATVVVLVGFLVLLASLVWYVYRIAKGWTRLNDGLPVG